MTPLLPVEIRDQIVDELSSVPSSGRPTGQASRRSRGNEALRKCLFVSREFRHTALKHLCASIWISNVDIPVDSIRLYILNLRKLFEPPTNSRLEGISKYVKHLHIAINTPSSHRLLSSRNPQSNAAEVTDDDNFIQILRYLRDVNFGIRSCYINLWTGLAVTRLAGAVAWPDLPTRFRTAFHELVRCPSLTSLEIRNISDFPITFLRGTYITYLHSQQAPRLSYYPHNLVDITTDDGSEDKSPLPRLETFVTDNLFPCKLFPELITNLKEYVTVADLSFDQDINRTSRIVEMASRSLRRLHLNYSGDMPIYSFDLSNIPHLRSFSHHHTRRTAYDLDDGDLSNICKLLNTRAPMRNLQSLGIRVNFRETWVDESFLLPFDSLEPCWEQLAHLLSGPQYPALTQFSLDIVVNVFVGTATDFNEELFESMMEVLLGKCFVHLPDRVHFQLKVHALKLCMGNAG